jgi:GT2 family glycosyltransferase
MVLLSIIIVNYNVKYFLEQCLCSVLKAMRNIDGEILVVDNASTDGSFEFFKNRFEQVNFIWNKTNVGFAKANNQALKIANGENILFLNPDTILPEDCFEKCLDFINKNNGALGIKMIDGAGNFLKESKRAFPSPTTSLFKLSGFSKLFPQSKTFSKYHLGYLNENENHEVDILAGAFMMIPKEILTIIGGFDEQFFMYGEDIDLSFRIQKAGFKNYYFAGSCIIHFKGESTKKGSLNYVKMFYKAMSIFVKKHYGSSRAGMFHFFIQLAILSRAALAAASRVFNFNVSTKKKKSENEFINAKNILQTSENATSIYQRLETDSTEFFKDFKSKIESVPVTDFVFCEGKISFKTIIEMMSKIAKQVNIQIFSEGCHAIIGSNDKDIAGNFINLDSKK